MKFRNLNAEDIECRISTVSEKGCSLLLYKDARCDMKILDESVGPMNWKRSHEVINGNLFCNVSIYDNEKREWITKQDVGTESYTEKEKGQASDSFKRACFNWGIGRELYTAPFIWVSSGDVNITKSSDRTGKEKYTTYDKFSVKSMTVENGIITAITIKNDKTKKICYRFSSSGKNEEKHEEKKEEQKGEDKPENVTSEMVKKIDSELLRTGIDAGVILDMYRINTFEELTTLQYQIIMRKFSKTKDKAVS